MRKLVLAMFVVLGCQNEEAQPSKLPLPPVIRQEVQQPDPPKQLRKNCLKNFTPFGQHGGNTCGAVAARNALTYLTKQDYNEHQLFQEIVAADHKALKPLEGELRKLGVPDPKMLSSYGTTPAGISVVMTEHLKPQYKAEYKEIPRFEDRLKFIQWSIDKNRPVVAPLVTGSLNHWTIIIGYDLDSRTLTAVNAGMGSSRGGYNIVGFNEFDNANSFKTLPSGILGKVFQLANTKGLGRCVLIYVKRTQGKYGDEDDESFSGSI